MSDKEKLDIITSKMTGLIFLNQQWFSHLRDVLDENDLLEGSLKELVQHAKEENRKLFNEIKELTK